jgi:hypothetical protein
MDTGGRIIFALVLGAFILILKARSKWSKETKA